MAAFDFFTDFDFFAVDFFADFFFPDFDFFVGFFFAVLAFTAFFFVDFFFAVTFFFEVDFFLEADFFFDLLAALVVLFFDFVDLPKAAAQPSEYFSFVPIRKIVMIFSFVSIQFL